jgi:phage-related protein (TIGR01555 family)
MGRIVLNDGLMSLHTRLGQKSEARKYGQAKTLSPSYLWNLYKSSWIVKKYIDKRTQDMTKRWREIQSNEFDADELAQFTKIEQELKVKDIAEEALMWASLFGDVLVLAVTDIAEEKYKDELNVNTEKIRKFVVIDRRAFTLGDIEDDITSDNFGNPKTYNINGKLDVHHSRVHRIRAGKLPLSEKSRSRYGVSDINSMYEAIKQFDCICTSISDLIEESNVDVLKVDGMNNQVSAGKENEVLEYAMVAKKVKSSTNMLLIDKNDDYDQKQANFSGLSDLQVKQGNVVAGATDTPITVMFGQSASGFNSGEEDNKNYYDSIGSAQESRLRPLLDFVDVFIFDKMGKKPLDWWYEFPTIDTMNKKDQASIFSAYCTGLASLIQSGIITEMQALKELKQKAVFENITDEDIRNALLLNGTGQTTGTGQEDDPTQSLIKAYQTQQAVRGLV